MKVSLEALNTSDKAEFVRLLDGLFEAAPWVAEKSFSSRPFATVASLHDAMMAARSVVGDTPVWLEVGPGHTLTHLARSGNGAAAIATANAI